LVTLPPVFVTAVPWDPKRAVAATRMVQWLHLAGHTATVVWDKHHDHYETFVRMLRSAGQGAAIFLEDDIEFTSNWDVKMAAEIAAHPDVLIQTYSNRNADLTYGSRWEKGKSYLNNQCWYVPPGMAASLADYLDTWPNHLDGTDPTGTDLAVSHYLHANRLSYWLVAPSLVQHRDWVSAINPKRPHGKMRQSKSYVP